MIQWGSRMSSNTWEMKDFHFGCYLNAKLLGAPWRPSSQRTGSRSQGFCPGWRNQSRLPRAFHCSGCSTLSHYLRLAAAQLHDAARMRLRQPDVPSSSCRHKCQATIGVQNQVVDPESVHIRDALKSRGRAQSSEVLMWAVDQMIKMPDANTKNN